MEKQRCFRMKSDNRKYQEGLFSLLRSMAVLVEWMFQGFFFLVPPQESGVGPKK